jgi:CheY-like chemotaxis protein/HPt (histidine-containing phosphotransfer) domain-containing protein
MLRMTLRILLVEDDPISRKFLCHALEALPAEVVCAETRAGALRAEGPFGLYLIDANLPDGSGAELLHRLRASAADTPALAHTADDSTALRSSLYAAGFAGVVRKPIQAEALRSAVREALGMPVNERAPLPIHGDSEDAPDWDDEAALKALGGNPANLATLRGMFLGELALQRDGVLAALRAGDTTGAHAQLHRLKASCGFVGAARLRLAADRLDQALPGDEPLPAFEDACRTVLASR